MKTRIFASLLVILIVFGLYVVTESDNTKPAQEQQVPSTNDSALKSLNLN